MTSKREPAAREPVAAAPGDEGSGGERPERFLVEDGKIIRKVRRRSNGQWSRSVIGPVPANGGSDLLAEADRAYLSASEMPAATGIGDEIVVADLFSGLGSLTLGAFEAARALNRPARLVLAADNDPSPLEVLRKSLGVDDEVTVETDLEKALGTIGDKRTRAEKKLLEGVPQGLEVLVAGPPCQGHSRLNNHTRHDDDRNDLYARVVRFCELKRPQLCIVENVDSIVNDQRRNAESAAANLVELGYRVDEGKVALNELGVAQRRRRHLLVATAEGEREVDVDTVLENYSIGDAEARNLKWAIGDLHGRESEEEFDRPSRPSEENKERMKWLVEHEGMDLPDEHRPKCHREPKPDENGTKHKHSYVSMYGQLDWTKPAQTITSGYGSMGQGRYVHPAEARTLTPHEAARLQFIPDFVDISEVQGRGKWARMIGNVAPMKLSYIFVLEFFR